MNVLIQIVHPAHFYYYRDTIANLKRDGHKVIVAIVTKDVLEDIVQQSGIDYVNIRPKPLKSKGKWGVIWDVLVREWRMMKLAVKNKVNLITASSIESAHVGWILRIPNVNIGEDDAHIVPKYTNSIAPFVDVRVTPDSCNNGKIESKSIHYPGFLKLTYLHPNDFTPSKEIVTKYGIDTTKTYFLMRFSALNAHHDNGIKGISNNIARRLVDLLAPHGDIYITSERVLDPELEQYRLQINPLHIHHVMAYATLYIGDSQSMANEAAMLGVPSLRFNDFVGAKKIGVMEEMEHVYGLTYGISSHEQEKLYAKVAELLAMTNLRETFQERRQKMLNEKIDVTAFLTWFIENYPKSVQKAKNADDNFWKQFK
jgi:predicted glycosyltransferase